jgi:fatty acid-binding protein DegV
LSLTKVYGSKRVIKRMIQIIKNDLYKTRPRIIGIIHAENYEKALMLKEIIKVSLNPDEIVISNVGSAIGCHTGPGAIGIAYFE